MNTTAISNKIIENLEISNAAFRLYCLLAMKADDKNYVCLYINQIADMLNKAPGTIRTNINELIEHRIITRITRMSPDVPKMHISNMFVINREEGE